jgi:hypothetical protein
MQKLEDTLNYLKTVSFFLSCPKPIQPTPESTLQSREPVPLKKYKLVKLLHWVGQDLKPMYNYFRVNVR